MRKIEVVAADYVRSPDLDQFHSYADIFLAGVRYVLDAMTSDDAVKAFADAVKTMDDQDIDSTPLEEIATALCAVRKEIEGG